MLDQLPAKVVSLQIIVRTERMNDPHLVSPLREEITPGGSGVVGLAPRRWLGSALRRSRCRSV
jgi:hypothetical protein